MNILENLGESIENFMENAQNLIQKSENLKQNSHINESEIELAKKLDAIEEYTLDRFEGNIAVLENRKTGEMKNIEKEKLPENLEEGSILKCINGKFILDENRTKEVEKNIQEKFNNLWKK